MPRYFKFSFIILLLAMMNVTYAEPLWLTLPPSPTLPPTKLSGFAPINNVKIWYASYGQGPVVILLHGAMGNSNYWGKIIPELAKNCRVIVMDSRGQGRSTSDSQLYSYDLMAADVLGLMDYLNIKQAAIVGWSDGAIIGLTIAIHHPQRLTKLFAFGANSTPAALNLDSNNPVEKIIASRSDAEYKALSKTPDDLTNTATRIDKMMATQPNFTKAQLNSIKVPTWIVDGDHDEVIKREDIEYMAAQITNAGLLIQPMVSHFSPLQDPEQFVNDVLHFLKSVT
jgi:pimeloyl-ACP methyl ester carboxylesterase